MSRRNDVGLLDTSVVIMSNALSDLTRLPARPAISVITLAELSAGPAAAPTPHEAAIRQYRLQQVEAIYDPIPFDDDAARAFGQVSADLRAAGRKASARGYDALIAATAVSRGLPLYTVNPNDFAGITSLDVRAVPHPDRG